MWILSFLARNKWFRAPAQSSCRAYIAARGYYKLLFRYRFNREEISFKSLKCSIIGEVRVLYWVSHPNVVPFIGLCQSPLSILMPRAPRKFILYMPSFLTNINVNNLLTFRWSSRRCSL